MGLNTIYEAPRQTGRAGETVVTSTCGHNCGGRCVVNAHVVEGRITRISTDARPWELDHPPLPACARGVGQIERVYHPDRLRYPMRRTVEIDLSSNETLYTLRSDGGEFDGAVLARLDDIDLDIGYYLMKRYRMIEDDPLSASTELFQRTVLRRDDWSVRLVCRTRLTATEKHFQFSCDLETFEGDRPFLERSWALSIPRQLV